jgi:hypothetical protein
MKRLSNSAETAMMLARRRITICAAVTAILVVSGVAQAAIIEGQGVWLFDEGAGLTTADSSGNSNTGTLVNGTAWTTDTPFAYCGNHALSFNGSDDYVSVADATSLDVTGAITVEAWLKPDTVDPANNWRAVVYKQRDSGPKGGYGLFVDEDQDNVFFFTYGKGVAWAGPIPLTLDGWNHVVGTFDVIDGDNNDEMKIYVNGELKESFVAEGYGPYAIDLPLYIGGNPNDGMSSFAPCEFAGIIDEVRILSRALSANEVLYDYEHSLVPEPATICLLGLGVLSLLRRRK